MAKNDQMQGLRGSNPIAQWLNSDIGLTIASFAGRLGICYLFLNAALYHATFGYDHTIVDMTARGIPFPGVLNLLAMGTSSVLALALLFDFRARWAALGLAIYTFSVSMVMYWPGSVVPPEDKVYLMKDMALFGALMLLACALARNNRSA